MSFIFFCSCNGVNNKIHPTHQININSKSPVNTFESLKNENNVATDSIYKVLFDTLIAQQEYTLLFEHLRFYSRLDDNGPRSRALLNFANGFYYSEQNNPDSANYFFQATVDEYHKLGLKKLEAEANLGLTTNYLFLAKYGAALDLQYKTLKMYEELRDTMQCYFVKTQMLNVLLQRKEYDRALKIALDSRDYYFAQKDTSIFPYIEERLSTIYYKLKDYPKSLSYALSALAYSKKTNNKQDIARSLNSVAVINMEMKHWDIADSALHESVDLVGDKRQLPFLRYAIASVMQHRGKEDSAIYILKNLVNNANTDPSLKIKCYLSLSKMAELSGKYPDALQYYKVYKSTADSVFSLEKEATISELNVKYATEKNTENLERLSIELKADAWKKLAYAWGIVVVAIVSLLIIFFLKNRNKQAKRRVARVEAELEYSKRELLEFTENIIAKNKLIEELEMNIGNAQTENTETDDMHLSRLYQFKILTDDDWAAFKLLFDKVYPGIINKLRQTFPNLKKADTFSVQLNVFSVGDVEPAYFALWIDYNHNNTFDSSELAMQNSNTIKALLPALGSPVSPINKVLTVPATAIAGITRARLMRGTSADPYTPYDSTVSLTPCPVSATSSYGCTYDFNVNIVNNTTSATNITQTPTAIIEIYPNPANNDVYVKGEINGATINIIDEYGRTLQGNITDNHMDVSQLASGLYFLQIANSTQVTITKLMIER